MATLRKLLRIAACKMPDALQVQEVELAITKLRSAEIPAHSLRANDGNFTASNSVVHLDQRARQKRQKRGGVQKAACCKLTTRNLIQRAFEPRKRERGK